ncbi:prolyl oligopeptidase family serine peptidase [Flavobacterium sp. 17A]|uniref:Prolyl oligopeptidase family serine peptidase n=1 Tax=Flavobacterium potami TaxID=2872310 RepID=A0A9X1H6V5_9FLAO|nr:prolyl oligopeptidase family serine peptidase [Flavobacterium potami]MBZ4033824.1 prolyl oligopeptidase family serine peptidase [Flavobacterium potami]
MLIGNYIKRLTQLRFFLFLFFILPLVACPLWGQVVQKKKQLVSSDYYGWGKLIIDKVSSDEKWVCYKMEYEKGNDTLFIRNNFSHKLYSFPKGRNGFFAGSKFICQIDKDIAIVDLKTAVRENLSNTDRYSYSQQTDQLIFLLASKEAKKKLVIRSLKNSKVREIEDVTDFSLCPSGTQLAYFSKDKNTSFVSQINLKTENYSKLIVLNKKDHFMGLTWNKIGNALAFYQQDRNMKINALLYYLPKEDKLYKLDSSSAVSFPKNMNIIYENLNGIFISDDGEKVFFSVKNQDEIITGKHHSDVEIWNGNDKWTYLQEKNFGDFENGPKTVMWIPKTTNFTIVTSNEYPKVILSGNYKYAIVSNPKQYEPQFDFNGPRDYYLLNLTTFQRSLLLQRQSYDHKNLIASPKGKSLAYFSENNWWVYNFEEKKHINLTASLGVKFTAKLHDLRIESICGSPGWTVDDNELVTYDNYDIWVLSTSGNEARRLTRGKEEKIRFRIADMANKNIDNYIYDGLIGREIDIRKDLILQAEGEDGKTGYFRWNPDGSLKPIVYKNSFIDQLNYGVEKKNFYFREQKFDISPQLVLKEKNKESITILKSNPKQEKFFWGKSELINYSITGHSLKAVLYYPAQYDPKIKYPMIVKIYDRQSNQLHKFENPTYENVNGFNTTLFTSENYFVLKPDLLLEAKNPGVSALSCVISAVNEVVETGIVDSSKIGLVGHSYGGFESSFIITQTQLFSAAIASGAITDLNSYYHTINSKSGKPDMWRFGIEQWTMQATPYEAPESYWSNSPIAHVKNVNTPVLLWTGKVDSQVDTHQSFEFYLALRRLGKKCIMLQYPDEAHLLIKPLNQKDVTERTMDWFRYFLKNDQSALWVEKGTK